MVMKIFADPGQVRHGPNAKAAQMIGVADTRDHEQPGRFNRARGQDHIMIRADFPRLAVDQASDTDASGAFEYQRFNNSMRQDCKIAAAKHW
jgi:hypothetical protein